ncbi:triphosphoribosyl-dephospho-CoA synthase [Isosphaeraceae bacterium EP7]
MNPGLIAQIACTFEVCARKPGNVHRGADFEDVGLVDFLLSAAAIAGPMGRARELGVGRTILEAVGVTRAVVRTNTNLGMILLLAPLAAVPEGSDLRTGVAEVLESTTVEDTRLVYRAIRMARPGGLGEVDDQDVAGEPTIGLVDAMRLAADRDLVARQYANGYADVFDCALPALRARLSAGLPLETAIIGAHLALLASRPETLIARKLGAEMADEARRLASDVVAGGWPEAPGSAARFDRLDAWMRDDGHARNPGASADLVTAALFAAVTDGTIELPRPGGPPGWSG